METVSGLKCRFEVDDCPPYSAPAHLEDDIFSSDSADSCDSLNTPSTSSVRPASILRRHRPCLRRKSVRFDVVTVYYFSRRHNFGSAPSRSGNSLGMAPHHSSIHRYTLGEFSQEQEGGRRLALRHRLRRQKLRARKLKLSQNAPVGCSEADSLAVGDVLDEDVDTGGVEVVSYPFFQPLLSKRAHFLLQTSAPSGECDRNQTEKKNQVERKPLPSSCSLSGSENVTACTECKEIPYQDECLGDDEESHIGRASCVESEVEIQSQQDSLALENEAAVLHLQSAEQRERQRELEEEEPGVCLIQGDLPSSSSVVCFSENPFAPQHTEPTPLVYYQLHSVDHDSLLLGREGEAESPGSGHEGMNFQNDSQQHSLVAFEGEESLQSRVA